MIQCYYSKPKFLSNMQQRLPHYEDKNSLVVYKKQKQRNILFPFLVFILRASTWPSSQDDHYTHVPHQNAASCHRPPAPDSRILLKQEAVMAQGLRLLPPA